MLAMLPNNAHTSGCIVSGGALSAPTRWAPDESLLRVELAKTLMNSRFFGVAGKTGTYIGIPELGMVNLMQAHEQVPNAPLGRDPDAWKKETMRTIEEVTGEPWTKQAPGPAPMTEE